MGEVRAGVGTETEVCPTGDRSGVIVLLPAGITTFILSVIYCPPLYRICFKIIINDNAEKKIIKHN